MRENQGKVERKSAKICEGYRDSMCQAKCWTFWIGFILLSLLEERGYLCSIHHICIGSDDTDMILATNDLDELVCYNSRDDGRVIVGIACSEIRLGP